MTDNTELTEFNALDIIDKFIKARDEEIKFLPDKTYENTSEWISHFVHNVNYRLSFNDWMRLDIVRSTLTRPDPVKAKSNEIATTRDAVTTALLEALKYARTIIGHPDDAGMGIINQAIAEAEKEMV